MELQSILPLELCQLIMIKRHQIGMCEIQKELLDIQDYKETLEIQMLEQIMENGGDIHLWTLNQIILLINIQQLIA